MTKKSTSSDHFFCYTQEQWEELQLQLVRLRTHIERLTEALHYAGLYAEQDTAHIIELKTERDSNDT